MPRYASLLALVSLALTLPGCTTAAAGSGMAMVGTHWRLTSIDGSAPVRQAGANLSFEQTRFSASVGCNSIGGDYRIETGRMISKSVMATQMYCEGPVWNQELAVIALLAGAPAIKRQGQQLRLESAGHSLEAEASVN